MKAKLTLDNINIAVAKTEKYLKDRKFEEKAIIKLRLSLEEALLNFYDRFGSEKDFNLSFGKLCGKTKLILSVAGESFDPLALNKNDVDNETSQVMHSMLMTLGQLPVWNYVRGINKLTFQIERKTISAWVHILIAIVVGVLGGFAFRLFALEQGEMIAEQIFSPLISTFFGFLCAIAGLMIFFSVVFSMYSMGDVNTVNTLGKKITADALIAITLSTVFTVFFGICFCHLPLGSSDFGEGLSTIYKMVLNIIPTNIVLPFSDGNTLQILAIALIIGFAMVILGDKVQGVATFAEQCNYIFMDIMGFVTRIMPFFIFISIFDIIVANDKNSLAIAADFIIGTIIGCAIMMLLHILVTAIAVKKSPFAILKNSFETFFIAFSTASSSAAYTSNLKTCTEKYQLDKKYSDFAVPFIQVLFKPGITVAYFMAVASVAEKCQTDISISWIITVILIVIILSAATPPVPGGSTASFSILFLQMGLPMDGLPIIIAVNILLDYFHTGVNVFCGQLLILRVGNNLKLKNQKIVKSD